MNRAGIILCGGKSERMGTAKAMLPFGDELLVQRVVRIVSSAVSPLVVVASPGQSLPKFPSETLLAYDRHVDQGPLEGFAVGLSALPQSTEAVFLTGCDTPFLTPLFIDRMLMLLDGYVAAVPKQSGRYHPLSAAFSRTVLPQIQTLLGEGHRRMGFLLESIDAREVSPDEWRDVDSESESLRNLNNPDDYHRALRDADLEGHK